MNAGFARTALHWALIPALGLALASGGCARSDTVEPRLPVVLQVDAGHSPPDAGPPDAGHDAGPPPLGCLLTYSPTSADFGLVPIGSAVTRDVQLTNTGDQPCDFASLVLEPGTDPEFTLPTSQLRRFLLAAGATDTVTITFTAKDTATPRKRQGKLTFELTRDTRPTSVPLAAQIAVGCELKVSPALLDFGSVPLNTSLTDVITLSNTGDQTCDLSQLKLDPLGSPLFSLDPAQPVHLLIAAEGQTTLPVTFVGDDSTEPHLRKTNVTFVVSQPTGLPQLPTHLETVPVQAFINTACTAGSQFIYTVDDLGVLSLFNPLDLTFTDIGTLDCPANGATPFSMAVDQNTVAWVEYNDGNLYRVDTTNAHCQSTSFVINPELTFFGMGFVFDPNTGKDTLYVAGNSQFGSSTSQLGTIDFPSLALTPGAPLDFGTPEITGTGDGQLWGFSPGQSAASGITSLVQIDPDTGVVLTEFDYPEIPTSGSWAVKFWGGAFYLFLSDQVYKVERTTGEETLVVDGFGSGHIVVGAGVSTCAPIQEAPTP